MIARAGRMMTRRRVMTISAAIASLGIAVPRALAGGMAPVADLHVWRGLALGADATLFLRDDDAGRARRLIALALAEIARLEAVFSLYRADSAIARLNAAGRLDAPPFDLLRVLELCAQLHWTSGGAFDPTVQPLWELLRSHFAAAGADDRDGPLPTALAKASEKVGFANVEWASARVAFARPGMALTLNGVAQGYIADRVCALLEGEGLTSALINLGEARALGEHSSSRPWRAAIPDPTGMSPTFEVPMRRTALATSSPLGTCFDAAARFTHLFDPATGASGQGCRVASVTATNAADADGLSTALAVRPSIIGGLIAAWPGVGARLIALDGTVVTLGDWPER